MDQFALCFQALSILAPNCGGEGCELHCTLIQIIISQITCEFLLSYEKPFKFCGKPFKRHDKHHD